MTEQQPELAPAGEQEELCEGASYESMNLAVMVLSDCGHSSNYKPLLERVAGRIDRHVERLLTAQHADRAMRAQAAPTPSEWDVRGRLAASLTCWHRLTGQEAAELVALFQGHPAQAAPAAVEWPSDSEIDALVASIGPTEGIRKDSRDLTPAYSIDADPQGIRARVADAITGALAFGAQGANPPPTGHWLVPFWETAREEASRNRPVSSDTLYLLRRLLSNQHALTSAEFREELTKIVGEATQAADNVLEDAARYRWLRDGNGYAPEECGITGGEELDELCDEGVATQAKESGA